MLTLLRTDLNSKPLKRDKSKSENKKAISYLQIKTPSGIFSRFIRKKIHKAVLI